MGSGGGGRPSSCGPGRQREAESQRTELAVQLDQLLGEEAGLTIVVQRLQARKAWIYWFGLQDQDREDAAQL
jgi:hypothetical protein